MVNESRPVEEGSEARYQRLSGFDSALRPPQANSRTRVNARLPFRGRNLLRISFRHALLYLETLQDPEVQVDSRLVSELVECMTDQMRSLERVLRTNNLLPHQAPYIVTDTIDLTGDSD